jgi:hypothetical protein
MRQLICLSLTLAFSVAAVAAQQRVRIKPEGDTRRADLAQRRAQAVDILKGVVEGAKEIGETQTHITVVTVHKVRRRFVRSIRFKRDQSA